MSDLPSTPNGQGQQPHAFGQAGLVTLGVGLEGLLGGLGWLWMALQGRDVAGAIAPSLEGTAAGAVAAAAAVVLMALVHDGIGPRAGWMRGWRQWVEEQLLPFLAPAGTLGMLAIAVSAGVGEELLFRGAMQPAIGLIPTAAVFGLAHVGGLVRREAVPYFLFTLLWGLVFGWAYELVGTLWPLMVLHAGYDFGAVMYLRRGGRDRGPGDGGWEE